MKGFHKLLQRQLRQSGEYKNISPALRPFFQAISDSYYQYERDRKFLERAMEISSRELLEANRKLAEELKNKQIAEQTIFEKNHQLLGRIVLEFRSSFLLLTNFLFPQGTTELIQNH